MAVGRCSSSPLDCVFLKEGTGPYFSGSPGPRITPSAQQCSVFVCWLNVSDRVCEVLREDVCRLAFVSVGAAGRFFYQLLRLLTEEALQTAEVLPPCQRLTTPMEVNVCLSHCSYLLTKLSNRLRCIQFLGSYHSFHV